MNDLSARQIGRVAYAAGLRRTALSTAIAVALAESGGRAALIDGDRVGLWQINQPVVVQQHPTWTVKWLQKPANSAAALVTITDNGRLWGRFPSYVTGRWVKHLPAANAAAQYAAESADGPGGDGADGKGAKDGKAGGGKNDDPDKPKPPKKIEEDPDPRARLGRVMMLGGKLKASVAEAVTEATLSWSTSEVTQLSLRLADPRFELFRSGLFEKGTAVLYREPKEGTYPGFDLELRITALVLDGGPAGTGGFTVQCRSDGASKLKKRRGPKVMKKVSPSEFVEAECKAVGLKCVAQKSTKRNQVARDVTGKGQEEAKGADKPSSWTTFGRLATELGYYVFEFAGTVYFGKPTWLIGLDKTPLQVALPLPGAPEVWSTRGIPTINMSEDADVPVEISDIVVERSRLRECRPGGAVQLRGLPPFNDLYLTTSMTMPLLGTGGIALSCATPKNPPPQPPAPPPSRGEPAGGFDDPDDTGVVQTGGKSAVTFTNIAISASAARYVYGGKDTADDPTPEALDCSGLITWALARMGIGFPHGSINQYAAMSKISVSQAFNTRGALLYKPGHIGISLGDGRSMEARNPTDGVGIFRAADIAWTAGGLVPALAYG